VTRWDDERGFSLTEVAVACALLMVILLPLLRFFDSAVSGANELQRSTQLQADDRATVDALTRELRQAYTGNDALVPVTVAADGLSITFFSPDTSQPFRLRQITYRVATTSGTLDRSATTSDQTTCPEDGRSCASYGPLTWTFPSTRPFVPVMRIRTTAPAFTATAVNGTVRRVDITLTGVNSQGRGDRPIRTSVDLRNV
jgi:Tfp pilus assembly protein PilV